MTACTYLFLTTCVVSTLHGSCLRLNQSFRSYRYWRRTAADASFELELPASSNAVYNLTRGLQALSYSQVGQDTAVLPLFEGVNDGFFVESGAYNGETDSNTLLLELRKKWSGLLVEPENINFAELMQKKRRAHAFHGCLSTTGDVQLVSLSPIDCGGPEYPQTNECSTIGTAVSPKGFVNVKCVPLAMLMEKTNRTTIDFWSLDVEGAESEILDAFDFKKIEVGVVLVEMNNQTVRKRPDGVSNVERIPQVLSQHGFVKVGKQLWDDIWVNPEYYKARSLAVPAVKAPL
eukprot:gnl/TRDRNA2_/TRDRNA2_128881_c0_seq1.p1 gnl/TRDRNA2_/TRDRNA2_128881_c0~~gnl/TRDRNA2_/TRDRNA2_128881_c0_seq1.p1  ORF type:complete len:290 (+),score=33.54 gnl/TRDRNA2_/TRDRNA2_128881_c0_seq1:49-918(+)